MTDFQKFAAAGGGSVFTTVDETIHNDSYDSLKTKGLTAIKSEHEDLMKTMKRAVDEAGDDFDLSKVNSLDGKTHEEKYEKFMEVHSKMSGAHQAMVEVNAMMNAPKHQEQKKARDMSGDVVSIESHNGPFGRESLIGGAIENAFKDKGLTLAEAFRSRSAADITDNRVLNAVFTTSAGMDPFVTRQPGVVDSAQNFPMALDIFPTIPVNTDAVKYLLETTYDASNVAPKNENATAGEATLGSTEQTVNVHRIPVFLPVSEEILEDAPMARAYIDRRLINMIRNELEKQVMTGNGTAPNLAGLSGLASLNDQALVAADFANNARNLPTKLFAGMYQVFNTGKTVPTNYALSTALWAHTQLSQDGQNRYRGGPITDTPMQRLWGLPVAQSFQVPYAADNNIGYVGDFSNYSFIASRHGLRVEMGMNDTDFIHFRSTIRVSVRAALVVSRPAAFTHFSVASGITLPAVGS